MDSRQHLRVIGPTGVGKSNLLNRSTAPAAEEFAIHDFEGFGAVRLGEYDQIDRVVALGQLIAKHGEAYAAYVDSVGVEEAIEDDFTTRYAGNYPSVENYVDTTIGDWGWDEELVRLQASSSIGEHLTIDRDRLTELVSMEWEVLQRPDGSVDIFTP